MDRPLVMVAGACLLVVLAGGATDNSTDTAPGSTQGPTPRPGPIEYVTTPTGRWMVHDEGRPAGAVITPGDTCGAAPSDAVVLFDGTAQSLEKNWTDTKGNPVRFRNIWLRELQD